MVASTWALLLLGGIPYWFDEQTLFKSANNGTAVVVVHGPIHVAMMTAITVEFSATVIFLVVVYSVIVRALWKKSTSQVYGIQ